MRLPPSVPHHHLIPSALGRDAVIANLATSFTKDALSYTVSVETEVEVLDISLSTTITGSNVTINGARVLETEMAATHDGLDTISLSKTLELNADGDGFVFIFNEEKPKAFESTEVPLAAGEVTNINVAVTSISGDVRTYTIAATRAGQ